MIQYRGFRNYDPPPLMEVWNACFTRRGAAPLHGPLFLEYFHLAKTYFDPDSLILALDDNKPVGFVQTGFGANATETALDRSKGVVCLLGVLPEFRRKGVGSELLRRGEEYLRNKGATEIFAGPSPGLNPYTFALYGGSDSPGFLDSDEDARPFFEKRGYKTVLTRVVYQRSLDQPPSVVDTRFPAHRTRYEIHAGPVHGTWWRECVVGPLEMQEFRMVDKTSRQTHARCSMWEMEIYAGRWQEHGVGLLDFEVLPDMRRRGLARFLLWQLLRHFREQFFSMIEMQATSDNTAGVNLLRSLGFQPIDTGRTLRREP